MQRIQFGINRQPEKFGVSDIEGALQQVKRLFGSLQAAVHERQMVGRNMTTCGDRIHFHQQSFGSRKVSRQRIGGAEPAKRVRGFAHNVNTPLRVGNRFLVPAHSAQKKTRRIEHHQVVRLCCNGWFTCSPGFVEAPSMVQTPHEGEARNDSQRIQIAREFSLMN